MSLGTKDAGTARVRAAAMTWWVATMAETLMAQWTRDGLTAGQCEALLRREVAVYRNKLVSDTYEPGRFGLGLTDGQTLERCERGWATLIGCGLGFEPTAERRALAETTTN